MSAGDSVTEHVAGFMAVTLTHYVAGAAQVQGRAAAEERVAAKSSTRPSTRSLWPLC